MAEPAQPTAILRGHKASVHAAAFVRLDSSSSSSSTPAVATSDTRLATGDSDGFVVLWDLAIVRPRAVWCAHEKSILGLAGWDDAAQVVTHGRDHKLIVWQLGVDDEARLSTALPLESEGGSAGGEGGRPRPWIVYMLEIGTVNFCSFAWCVSAATAAATAASAGGASVPERLVAVTNALTLEAVDIFHLPSQRRVNTVQLGINEGMVMALGLFYMNQNDADADAGPLVLLAAFENGVAVVATLDRGIDGPATIRYRAKTHTQPILSLDVAPDQSYFLTSAADAVVAKHPIPVTATAKRTNTAEGKHEKDTSTSTPEAAVPSPNPKSLLSMALAQEAETAQQPPPPQPSQPRPRPPASPPEPSVLQTEPLQVTNTKHAGQQGLRIRADGRLFATGGWDGRVRVYSAKTLREVAVLKWHQAGCFAVAFAPVGRRSEADASRKDAGSSSSSSAAAGDRRTSSSPGDMRLAARQTNAAVSVKARRLQHALEAHWLAAGSKDGKVSLWDIF